MHSCKEADPTIQFVISRNTADVGEEIEFTNGTQGAATYEWDFGDGTSSTEENPKKKYSKPGKFIVTLTGITKKKKIVKSKSLEIQINSIEEYCKGSIDGSPFEFTLDDAKTTAAFTSNLNLTLPPNNSSGFFGYGFDNGAGKGIDVNFGKLFFQGSEPDSTAFKAMFAAGQKSYLPNEATTNLGVEIRYFDGLGNIYSSFDTSQSGQTFNITSFKTGKDLARYYANAEVFVFPSRWETFGIVMIEAMACGTPVAAFPCDGPLDVIDQAETGFMNENLQDAVHGCMQLNRERVLQGSQRWSWENAWKIFKNNLT